MGLLCLAFLHVPFHVGPLPTSKEGAAARAGFRKQGFLALELDVSVQPACQARATLVDTQLGSLDLCDVLA